MLSNGITGRKFPLLTDDSGQRACQYTFGIMQRKELSCVSGGGLSIFD